MHVTLVLTILLNMYVLSKLRYAHVHSRSTAEYASTTISSSIGVGALFFQFYPI